MGCVTPLEDSVVIGAKCNVKEGKKVYEGKILGIGKTRPVALIVSCVHYL